MKLFRKSLPWFLVAMIYLGCSDLAGMYDIDQFFTGFISGLLVLQISDKIIFFLWRVVLKRWPDFFNKVWGE